MLFSIGIFAGTHSDLSKKYCRSCETTGKAWRILPEEKDILLLRNQPHHIIEGTGAAGMLLGETENDLRMRYGEPAYRDYADPEVLTYTEANFNASYLLKNGVITEIRLEVEKRKVASFEWFTALNLHETDIQGHTALQASDRLSRFYRTRRVRQVGESVHVLSRGVRFLFRRRSVIRVDVMAPADYAD